MPDIIGMAIIFPVTRGYLILNILPYAIPRSDLIVSALVCPPLVVQPLIQVFEVAGSLVRVLNKSDPFDMIRVTSFVVISIFAILLTTTTAISVFSGSF